MGRHAHVFGGGQVALDEVVQRLFGWVDHHGYRNIARNFRRALNTCVFDVFSLTPSSSPICLCSSPSTSCRTNAILQPSGSCATARSMSMRAPGVSRVTGM